MKYLPIICIAFLVGNIQGQDLKKELQGRWICKKIVDSLNVESEGKFGKSNEYLQFWFNKPYLTILEAPFDRGTEINYELTKADSVIDLYPRYVYPFTERKYKVVYLAGTHMVLQTINIANKSIFYAFTRQDELAPGLKDSAVIDCGTIIVKHLKLDKGIKLLSKVSDYNILCDNSLMNPTPYFVDYECTTFGQYYAVNFVFPEDFQMGTTSSEQIVAFDVSKKGAENITIEQSINPGIDRNSVNVIKQSRKGWKPVVISGKTFTCRVRLHFYYYKGKFELPNDGR